MNYLKVLLDLYGAKNNVKKSAAQIGKLQHKKLLKMLKHAYSHSEYYRQTFQAAGITLDNIADTPLEAFPTIDKQILLSHFDEIITVSDITQDELRRFDESAEKDRRAFKGKYHVVHSSGSTGKPGYFVYDNNAWNDMLNGSAFDVYYPYCYRVCGGNYSFRAAEHIYFKRCDNHHGNKNSLGFADRRDGGFVCGDYFTARFFHCFAHGEDIENLSDVGNSRRNGKNAVLSRKNTLRVRKSNELSACIAAAYTNS